MSHFAEEVVKTLAAKKLTLTTVESCTGGGLANAITDIPGASEIFKQGFVVYCNEAKIRLARSVDETGAWARTMERQIAEYSVYSFEVAREMAAVGMRGTGASVSVGVTGSLSRVDPANAAASKVGEVYVYILFRDETPAVKKLVKTTCQGRPGAKSDVIDEIMVLLLGALA